MSFIDEMFPRPEPGTLDELAGALVNNTENMMQSLVNRRKATTTQEAVAERIGCTIEAIKAFERYDADPRLSTIRRYALAVHACVYIEVEPEEWAA